MNGPSLFLRTKCRNWNGCAKRWCSSDHKRLKKTPDALKNVRNHKAQLNNDNLADNFDGLVEVYRQRARDSVLIRCPFGSSLLEVKSALLPFATYVADKRAVCYRHAIGDNKLYNYYLCDIGRANVNKLIRNLHPIRSADLPVRMRLLLMSGSSKRVNHGTLESDAYTEEISLDKLKNSLSSASSFDEQMNRLVDETELKPTGVAIRFFVASLIEDIFSGIFPLAACTPFGSTLNGFGKRGGDLDMNLEFQDSSAGTLSTQHISRLYIAGANTKNDADESGRLMIQKTLHILASILPIYVPFCQSVLKILNARVPIIRFNMSCCAVNCDVTANNNGGGQMAKILWLYSRLDPRLRPLIFTVRYWAKCVGVTRSNPGPWLTNFNLVCLILFYMQFDMQKRFGEPNLPSIGVFRPSSTKYDAFGIVSRPRDIVYSPGTPNKVNSALLLLGFFEFYSTFNFNKYGLCLETGNLLDKPLDAAMFILNPTEKGHNITKNVTQLQLDEFLKETSRAADLMRTYCSESLNSHRTNENWGLLKLCEKSVGSCGTSSDFSSDNDYGDDHISTKNDNTAYVGQSKLHLKSLFDELKSEQNGGEEENLAISSRK